MKTPEAFMDYFRVNYPGPRTIITSPDWHAPKIYAAAISASGRDELLAACKEAVELGGTSDEKWVPLTTLRKMVAAIAKAEVSQ